MYGLQEKTMLTNELLIQTKNTKRIKMYHNVNTNDAIIELVDDEGQVVNRLTIPERNIYSVIRGFLSDRQRFYRKKVK